MIHYGKQMTCDSCGKIQFLAAEESLEWDGPYVSKMLTYEETDWKYKPGIGHLCPKCHEKFKRMVKYTTNRRRKAMFKEGRMMTCDICGKEEFQESEHQLNHIRNWDEGDYVDAHCALAYSEEKQWAYIPGLGTVCPHCHRAITDLFGLIKERGAVSDGKTEEREREA